MVRSFEFVQTGEGGRPKTSEEGTKGGCAKGSGSKEGPCDTGDQEAKQETGSEQRQPIDAAAKGRNYRRTENEKFADRVP